MEARSEYAGAAKSRFLSEEYQLALTEVGWKTTSFEMVNAQNQVVYHLVFATQNPKGLEAMKRAMRRGVPDRYISVFGWNFSCSTSVCGARRRN